MASRKKPVIRYRRKRSGKTDYKQRLALLLSKQTRLVVRKTNSRLIAQFIQYFPTGDKVLVSVDSSKLKKDHNWEYSLKNIPAAYLLGIIAGKQAISKKINSAVLDLGRQSSIKGSKLYAVLKGAKDAGVNIPAGDTVYPKEDRLKGEHISKWSETSKLFTKQKNSKELPKKMEAIKSSVLK